MNKPGAKRKYFTEEEKRLAHLFAVKKWIKNHPEEFKKRQREYYHKNIEKRREYSRKYHEENREKESENRKLLHLKNKKQELEYNKTYRRNRPEWSREQCKNFRKTHPDYKKNRLKTDISFKLREVLRDRLKGAIRNNYKSGSAVSDLGCSIPELKIYLENKFQPGMSWENYGFYGWHIDHIVPLVNFNLSNRDEFLKAFHHTNLQPLWAKENLIKSKKILSKESKA